MKLTEAFDLYRLDQIIFRNQSPKTEESHNSTLKRMLEYFGNIEVSTLTFERIRDFKIHLDKGRDPSTVREYIIRLRMVLKNLTLRGYPTINYELIPVPKRIQKVPEFLTKEQVAILILAVSKPVRGYAKTNRLRNAAVISLLYASGIRASELCSLDRSSIREDGTFTLIGKGGKARLCFTDERTVKLLADYQSLRKDTNKALFITDQTGKRISKQTLQRIFEVARKKVNFDVPLHAHILRHSFATNLLRSNANMRYVQVLLGHTSIQTTQIYSHVVDEDLKQIYALHHTA